MKKTIRIDFRPNGEGTLQCVGLATFRCLGKQGMSYPRHVYINPNMPGTKQNPHYSAAYECPPHNDSRGRCTMKFSILIVPEWGVYIHEWHTGATIQDNGGATHGCIHLDEGNAETVYNWVDCTTALFINYPWPMPQR